jgi:predicted Zn finger-like uncharacterized protein
MRLACPSCHAGYEVPDDRLGDAVRRLRCARCGHEWSFAPAPPPPPAPAPSPPLRPPVEPRVAPLVVEPRPAPPTAEPPPRPGRAGALVAWVASILVLVGLGVAAVHFRAEITATWPPAGRLYAALDAWLH